jgi:hypothetical protein
MSVFAQSGHRDEPRLLPASTLPTRARRIAENIAKLPEPLSSPSFPTPDTSGRFHLAAHENNYLSQKNKISSTARAEIKNKSARARRSHFDANPRQSKKVMLFALLLATAVLLVRDPTGKWTGDPLQSWFDHLRNNAGMYCCAKADGHPLDDGEWDTKGNRYRVFVKAWGLLCLTTRMFLNERKRITLFAMAERLPTILGFREGVKDGALMGYGVNLRESWRRVASFVDKILQGAKPGDLPIEFPTKLELLINLITAKALELNIPPTLLARADEAIE